MYNIALNERITIKRKSAMNAISDTLQGIVIAINQRFFVVKTLTGWKESIDFEDIKAGRAKIIKQEYLREEKPVEEIKVKEPTISELIERAGLKGKLSEDMVARFPKEKIQQLLDEGKGYNQICIELKISNGTLGLLKKLYEFEIRPKPKAAKKPGPVEEAPKLRTEMIEHVKEVPVATEEKRLTITFKDKGHIVASIFVGVHNILEKLKDDDVIVNIDIRRVSWKI